MTLKPVKVMGAGLVVMMIGEEVQSHFIMNHGSGL